MSGNSCGCAGAAVLRLRLPRCRKLKQGCALNNLSALLDEHFKDLTSLLCCYVIQHFHCRQHTKHSAALHSVTNTHLDLSDLPWERSFDHHHTPCRAACSGLFRRHVQIVLLHPSRVHYVLHKLWMLQNSVQKVRIDLQATYNKAVDSCACFSKSSRKVWTVNNEFCYHRIIVSHGNRPSRHGCLNSSTSWFFVLSDL